MGGPKDYHIEWSERIIQIPRYHLYVGSKIWYKWMYLQNRSRLTENKYMVTKGEGGCFGESNPKGGMN